MLRMKIHGICGALLFSAGVAWSAAPRAEVMHWWTSGGESAAVRRLAAAYRAAGGEWVDTAVAGSEQARAIAINRIVGGDPPTAALFNTSKQFLDLIEQGSLENVDVVALRDHWDQILPAPILNSIRIKGHYYAAPVSIHMPTWIWYSKAAFRKAGIAAEPRTIDELFADLDRLKAAGLIPLAHGGQPWQENILFRAMLANVGGQDLYLKVVRDRDARAIQSPVFRQVLLSFKRLRTYVDAGSPGRNWNDATALLVTGRAGVQIMGDWVKAEFALAKMQPERDFGCIAGFGARAPYIVQGDAFIFPKSGNAQALAAQRLLATVVTAPRTQVDFSAQKGSIPIRADVDPGTLDACARKGLAILKDRTRLVGNDEAYLTPDQNGALSDLLTDYWNRSIPVETVQAKFNSALTE
ncbi:MAG: ABC transporter substrate-binding protein [Steroidobacteraceae bacterium]